MCLFTIVPIMRRVPEDGHFHGYRHENIKSTCKCSAVASRLIPLILIHTQYQNVAYRIENLSGITFNLRIHKPTWIYCMRQINVLWCRKPTALCLLHSSATQRIVYLLTEHGERKVRNGMREGHAVLHVLYAAICLAQLCVVFHIEYVTRSEKCFLLRTPHF